MSAEQDELREDPATARAFEAARDLRVLNAQLRKRMREKGNAGDFTPSQVAVLVRLEREGEATVTSLAQAEGVRPQSMGATVAVLQAADLVEGHADPRDGRRTVLSLTANARERFAAGRAAKDDWLFRTIQNEFSSKEQDELIAALELLKRIVASPG